MHNVLVFPGNVLPFYFPLSSKATFNVTPSLSLSFSSDHISGVLFKVPEAAAPRQQEPYVLPTLEALQDRNPVCSTPRSVLGAQYLQHLSN